ncbi:MAG: glycosyltransferase [Gemmatimonadales bacterium]
MTLALLAYAYIGYPILIARGPRGLWRSPRTNAVPVTGRVVLCAAYNEEQTIRRMVEQALSAEPGDAQVIVVSDASSDRTDEIVAELARGNDRVRLLRAPERGGKNRALNLALRDLAATPDVAVVFTDANAVLDRQAVIRLVDGLNAGATCVVGQLVFTDAATATARAEGLYWRYENAIKRGEGRLGRLPVANGAIFALRAGDCGEIPPGIGNDLYLPLAVLGGGRRVVFDETALAYEPATLHRAEEFSRKRRMANRQIQGTVTLWPRLDWPTRVQFISHKVIRWFGIPLLAIAFVCAATLAQVHWAYAVVAAGFAAPFILAALQAAGIRSRIGALGEHFVVVHWAVLLGIADLIRGRSRAVWSPPSTSRSTE